ncbi:acyl-CoA synthetase [Nocardia sp. NPDC127579]|uniref:acyl-CoA synthetase n=1 Tax=Nocardia sp. NPDC127579 TaxID=3345402 RepID=UPI003631267E
MANNFADLYEHAADAMGDRVAVIEGDRELSFAELDANANRLAHYLASIGVRAGTHVGFQMHNGIATLETLIACFKLRAVPININFRYGPDELRYVYDNADLEVLVYHAAYAPGVRAAAPRVPSLRELIVVGENTGGATSYAEALASGAPDRDFGPRSADDLFMMYTGGTTGLPKGVMWRQEDMWRVLGGGIDFYTNEPVADEFQQSRLGAQQPQATWFVLPPLIHAAAMMPTFTALWAGNAVVFEPRFEARRVWEVVQRRKPHVLVITGDAMARPLIDAYRARPVQSSVIAIGSGAALLSQSVKNTLLELFPSTVVTDSIGSSETGFGGIGYAQRDDNPGRGPRVRTGRGAVVVGADGRPVGPEQEGWLAKTGSVPLGYYKDPAKSDKLFRTVDGVRMVVTDDRARQEADGSITLLGRGNMVVNTGGEKVFVEEVEAVVKAHAAIYDAVVIGVPHERWGQQVGAVISATAAVEFGDLEAHVRKHLAAYKLPRQVWIAERLERSPSGKPDYGWAKEYAAQHDPAYRAR